MMPLLMKESLGTYFFLYDFFHRQRVLVKSGGCRKVIPPPYLSIDREIVARGRYRSDRDNLNS